MEVCKSVQNYTKVLWSAQKYTKIHEDTYNEINESKKMYVEVKRRIKLTFFERRIMSLALITFLGAKQRGGRGGFLLGRAVPFGLALVFQVLLSFLLL